MRHALAAFLLVCGGCDATFRFDDRDAGDAGSARDAEEAGIAAAPDGGPERDAGDGSSAPGPCADDFGCLAGLHCDVATHTCVACLADAQCPSAGGGHCDPTFHRCVACLRAADCRVGHVCEPRYRTCVDACDDDAECRVEGTACNVGRGFCIQCASDANCPSSPGGRHCDVLAGRCVECLADVQCTAPTPHCDDLLGRCVP